MERRPLAISNVSETRLYRYFVAKQQAKLIVVEL